MGGTKLGVKMISFQRLVMGIAENDGGAFEFFGHLCCRNLRCGVRRAFSVSSIFGIAPISNVDISLQGHRPGSDDRNRVRSSIEPDPARICSIAALMLSGGSGVGRRRTRSQQII